MIHAPGSSPRIALIGVSGYARAYVEWLLAAHKQGKLRLEAVSILPSERYAETAVALEEISPKVYDSYEQMFAAEKGTIDLCFIPTGIHLHAAMTIAALESGSNVHVEKPLAVSLADVDRIQAAEKRNQRWVSVGFQDLYASEIVQLKQSLVDGTIGKLKSVSMLGVWPRNTSYYYRNPWAGKLTLHGQTVYDSPLNNAFAHYVNLSLYLAGESVDTPAKATVGKSELYHAHQIETFDTAVVNATTDSAISLWFGVTHASADTIEPRIRIEGERGSIVWERDQDCMLYPQDQEPIRTPYPKHEQCIQNMHERVLERLHNTSVSICGTSIAKSQVQLIEDLHQNAIIEPVCQELIVILNQDSGSESIPTIKDIAKRLEAAYQVAGELGDLSSRSLVT